MPVPSAKAAIRARVIQVQAVREAAAVVRAAADRAAAARAVVAVARAVVAVARAAVAVARAAVAAARAVVLEVPNRIPARLLIRIKSDAHKIAG